ncbi:MAG: TfoX/Sxy family protein [Hyphomonadaceae bacterium]
MSLSPGFSDYVLELLAGFGRLEAKRMFGGAGLYRDGVMFAILDDDVVYFRVDDALETDLKAQGSVPWSYPMKRDGAVREMGYWRMPETAADDPDEAVAIAKRAFAAAIARKAVRAKAPASKKPATKAGEPKIVRKKAAARPRAKK